MPLLWTPELRRDFHGAVETLRSITENPSEEEDYRNSLPDIPSTHYTFRLKDELKLADHVAFLAHSQEGVQAISAACVEEGESGLVIRLASNSTPSAQTVLGLTKILNTFSNGACDGKTWSVTVLIRKYPDIYSNSTGTPSNVLEERLFEDVLDLSKDRILQRIRPPWIRSPVYYRNGEEPLWTRIQSTLTRIKFSRDSTPYDNILSRLEEFTSNSRGLKYRPEENQLRNRIKKIIRSCAEISYSGGHKSLEQFLELITPNARSDLVTKEVLQIDKLARYLGLCRDLGKLSQRCNFRNTTKTITLQYLEAPRGEKPIGASKTCYVHAEVQLILNYERYSTGQPPRAIGCSKSACFLCDTLIQKLGKYSVSYAHKRLYHQWTISDVSWMTTEQVSCFRNILQAIIADISLLKHYLTGPNKRNLLFRSYGLESRAVLPLSSNSSLGGPSGKPMPKKAESDPSRNSSSTITKPKSISGQGKLSSPTQKDADSATDFTLMHPAATLSCLGLPEMLDLSKKDLPHNQELGSKAETCLVVGNCCSYSTVLTVRLGPSLSARLKQSASGI